MSIEGQGKICEYMKGRVFIYIPADVRKDSTFPFKIGDRVKIRIESQKLIVEKVK
jgi:hypothetical protein